MADQTAPVDLSAELGRDLPFLRRYARALTGAQDSGDRYAIATLEAIVAEPSLVAACSTPKIGLFRTFHGIWSTSGAPVEADEAVSGLMEERAQWRLATLAPNTREVLLLHSLERFSLDAIAEIMQLEADEVSALHAKAMSDMAEEVSGDILIIEDEGIIAMDLQGIVTDMGHSVTSIARTHKEALAKGTTKAPDLILADIQLADKSSGIDAVNDLLAALGERPVIFITAFPERLLTGERPEPAFLISKPYSEEEVRAAVSQAMFFASTAPLSEAV